jgi:hypothetical protein
VNDGRRPALAAQLANLLQKQGVEVQKLEQDFEARETPSPTVKAAEEKAEAKTESKVGDKKKMEKSEKSKEEATAKKTEEAKTTKLPLGSYIIRMDQPYSRMADMLLDTQYYSTNDPRPYDTRADARPLRNAVTVRITDTAIPAKPDDRSTRPLSSMAGRHSATCRKRQITGPEVLRDQCHRRAQPRNPAFSPEGRELLCGGRRLRGRGTEIRPRHFYSSARRQSGRSGLAAKRGGARIGRASDERGFRAGCGAPCSWGAAHRPDAQLDGHAK